MGSILLIVVSILSSLEANTQTYPFTDYNLLINKAEHSFITADYITADSLYKNAFKINPYPHATDIQNALINALNAGEYKSGFSYAFMLSKLGAGSAYFEKNSFIFSRLNGLSQWDHLIAEAGRNRKHINDDYGEVIATLKRYHESTEELIKKYYCDFSTYTIVSSGIRTYSDSLQRLFEKYGYMSEYEIGVNIQDDTLIVPPTFSNIISYTRYIPGKDGTIEVAYNDRFEKILTKALLNGKISPYYFYSVYTDSDFVSIEYNSAYRKNDTIFIPYMNDDDINAINNKRQRFGLGAINSYKSLLKYYFKNRNTTPFTLPINVSPFVPDQDSQNNIKVPL